MELIERLMSAYVGRCQAPDFGSCACLDEGLMADADLVTYLVRICAGLVGFKAMGCFGLGTEKGRDEEK